MKGEKVALKPKEIKRAREMLAKVKALKKELDLEKELGGEGGDPNVDDLLYLQLLTC